MKKLKICHFTYSFFPIVGGMEEVIHNLSICLVKQGHESYVFAPYVRGKDNSLDVPYKVLRYSRPSSQRFGLSQLLIPMLWYHFKYRFDIIHCHGVYPCGFIGLLFHKVSGVPFVITPHGGDIRSNEMGYIKNLKITSRIKKALSKTQAVTAISSDIRNRVLNLGVTSTKIFVIPNGVFVNDFLGPVNIAFKDPYILYLGSLRKVKGVDLLLLAFAEIKKIFSNVKLKIAGEGPEKNSLQILASNLGITRDVEFLGIVTGGEKVNLLKNALFLVLPSRYESFGIVILEAFASGRPVIASNVGGIPDIVKDGENGFLVEPENTKALTKRMEIMILNNDLRNIMGQKALQSVKQYDWHNIVNEYINIYSKIL